MSMQKTGAIYDLGEVKIGEYNFIGSLTERIKENDIALELSPTAVNAPSIKVHMDKSSQMLNISMFRKNVDDEDYLTLFTQTLTLFKNNLAELKQQDS